MQLLAKELRFRQRSRAGSRLRLERQHDATTRRTLERHEMRRVAQQLVGDGRHRLRRGRVRQAPGTVLMLPERRA
jgi:hypothetical protein